MGAIELHIFNLELTALAFTIASLPKQFSTPMFWDDSDLQELRGTAIFGTLCVIAIPHVVSYASTDKIGKDDADAEYRRKIIPLLSVTVLATLHIARLSMYIIGKKRLVPTRTWRGNLRVGKLSSSWERNSLSIIPY